MISSASTLFFASLVFNAVSVLGAPIRIPDASSEVIARAEIPAQPAPAAIVDLNATHRKRSRVVTIPRARFVAERDAPLPEAIETRQPLDIAVPAVEKRDEEPTIQRRYPRKIYHDFYEKREPATTIKESTLMIEKTTVHDTPADAAAAAALNANSGGGANAPVVPGAPTDASSTSVTTLISVSQTTTISSPGATPSAATPPAGGDPPAVPAGGEPATPPAGGDAPAVPAGGAPAATPAGGDAPTVPAGGDPAAAATTTTSADTPAATPAPPAGGDAATPPGGDAGAGTPATPAAGGADAGGDNKPAGGDDSAAGGDDSAAASTTTSDATPAATATPAAGDNATPSGFTGGGARRALKATTEPVARRLASSGAAWASSIRRSLVNSN